MSIAVTRFAMLRREYSGKRAGLSSGHAPTLLLLDNRMGEALIKVWAMRASYYVVAG